jgi:hypothetical protein
MTGKLQNSAWSKPTMQQLSMVAVHRPIGGIRFVFMFPHRREGKPCAPSLGKIVPATRRKDICLPIVPWIRGASVTLRFRIAKAEQPIVIQSGAVAWTAPKKYLGVRFVSLQPQEERALNRYLTLLNELFLTSPREQPE